MKQAARILCAAIVLAASPSAVYNHNVRDFENIRWRLESNQLLVKIQYAFRR